MAVKSRTLTRSNGRPFPTYRAAAVIAAGLSFLTTLWAVEWVWNNGNPLARFGIALVIELLFTALKSALFRGDGSDGIGWAGFIFDAVVNMGGALPRAGAVVTFPPLAAVLGAVGLLPTATTVMATVSQNPITYGGFIIALIAGIMLSIAPHYLWERGGTHDRDVD